MAIDSYMMFQRGDTKAWVAAESQVSIADNSPLASDSSTGKALKDAASGQLLFEIEDYSFGVEQTLNIGSQSSGAGAGKITFNPFSLTRKIDKSSPQFFQMACSGVPFSNATLFLRKSTGDATGGGTFLRFDFKLMAVKTIDWSHDDESPKETITFEYGALQMRYSAQTPDGKLSAPVAGSWSRVTNKSDFTIPGLS